MDKPTVMGEAVSQRARDAVQAFHREMGRRLMADIKTGSHTLDAKGDDSDPIYQAFARLESECTAEVDALRAEIDRLRLHIANTANTINIAGSDYDTAITAIDSMMRRIKTEARAALTDATNRGEG